MRALLLLVSCLLLPACAALRDDLRRAEAAFDEARYEDVEVWLADLSPSVPEMDRPSRARFYYLRGISAFRLGDTSHARHYLALCREEAEEQGVGLRGDWRVTLAKVLSEIDNNAQPTAGGEAVAPAAAAPTGG